MSDPNETGIEAFLASMPKPTPVEMAAAFDPGTWAFSIALFKTLVSKGLFTASDLMEMHADMVKTSKDFGSAGEIQRVESVNIVADWLERYAGSLDQHVPEA